MIKPALLSLGTATLALLACTKSTTEQPQNCIQLHDVPQYIYNTTNNVYSGDRFAEPICGILPMHKKNYWVYRDSLFDYSTGAFQNVYIDTLRFQEAYMYTDTITWWKPVVSFYPGYGFYYKGFYDRVYSVDSVLYTLTEGSFGFKHSIQWFFLLTADSVDKSSAWNDTNTLSAYGKKYNDPVVVPAGTFNGCIFYEKYFGDYNYYNQDIYFKPGVGVVKSYQYYYYLTAPLPVVLTVRSDLISYHIE
ncbi:MAG TPA: hypothetical protein PKC72_14445 [Chitinophagaceae bacterium]|nr:hypothetical protein [Chitinophagaceae bacterium]